MDGPLYLPQYEELGPPEKTALMQTLAERYGLLFKGLRTFSRWGRHCTTGLFEKAGRELVLVPGDTVTLGWERLAVGLGEADRAELEEVRDEYAYPGTLEELIREDMAPVRQVTIAPMLVSRQLEEIGWEPVTFQDPRLLAHPDWLEDFRQHERAGGGGLNLVGCARFDCLDGQWQPYLSYDMTYPQLRELLRGQGFSLPTADEWAYLCGGGCRTLFPWGDGIDLDMHLRYFEDPEKKGTPYDMQEPNFFGLSIAYDPYKREVVEAETFTTCGGDGGCNLCGGMGPLMGFLSCSPHWKPEVHEDDMLDNDFDFCRPIIRVDID